MASIAIGAIVALSGLFAVVDPGRAGADYATDCANPTHTYPDVNGMPANLNLTSADVVLFASGAFTGSVNSSLGTICVAPGAAFNPANINGATRLFVRGTSTLPALAAGTGAVLDNEGSVVFMSPPNTNGAVDVINRAGASIVVIGSGLALGPAVSVTNDGTIQVNGGVNLNGSTITNNSLLNIGGPFNIVGSVTNTGHAVVTGALTVNGGGTLTNSCSLAPAASSTTTRSPTTASSHSRPAR